MFLFNLSKMPFFLINGTTEEQDIWLIKSKKWTWNGFYSLKCMQQNV